MSEKSAAELERDADIARAKVADTAESIRSKMTPGQLIDEFTGMFSGGDGSAMLGNLKSQVRDNPLPLTLIGAGLAWLMLGNGTSATNSAAAASRKGMAPCTQFSDPRGAVAGFQPGTAKRPASGRCSRIPPVRFRRQQAARPKLRPTLHLAPRRD